MTDAAPLLSRIRRLGRFVGQQPLTLWVAFVLAHLWLGMLNLQGPGYPMGDVTSVYRFWVDQLVVRGFVVGIDSVWVYPIVAFVPMLLAFAFGGDAYGPTWLSMVMLLNLLALGVLTGWGRRRERLAAGWWWLLFLVALGPIALGRIDAVSVALAMVGVLLLAQRPRLAAVILAVATWIKVWPAAVIAAALIATKERLRVLLVGIAVSVSVIAASLLLGGGANVFSFVTQQAGRGLQVEAPVSTIWLWLAASGVPATYLYYNQQILTYQITGPGAELAAALMTPLLAVAALAVCALGIRAVRAGATASELLPVLSLALVAAFIVFNKVGSPQFESWLAVPVVFGIVSAGRGGRSFRAPLLLALVIAVLTQLIYPYLYHYLLALDPLMLMAITGRNALLVVLFGWAVSAVVQLGRPGLVHAEMDERELPRASWPFGTSGTGHAARGRTP